jgi:hypothetical protein
MNNEYIKILKKIGFQRIYKNFDGSSISNEVEQWNLYLRYKLIIDLKGGYFYLINYRGDSVGPCYNILLIDENLMYERYGITSDDINEYLSDYRDYKIDQVI